ALRRRVPARAKLDSRSHAEGWRAVLAPHQPGNDAFVARVGDGLLPEGGRRAAHLCSRCRGRRECGCVTPERPERNGATSSLGRVTKTIQKPSTSITAFANASG